VGVTRDEGYGELRSPKSDGPDSGSDVLLPTTYSGRCRPVHGIEEFYEHLF